jgi:ATP-dependent DNA helicase HFM1/MER3
VINENLIKKKDNPNKNFKIIYLAPIKSLCQEKLSDWKQRFSKLNIGVTESTGDTEYINFPTIFTSNIILTTPEKFDSITRKWKEYSSFISNISLILIDEVHLLNDPTRGATLEAIVARMKLISLISKNQDKNLRIIALSATIPNISELAEWLNAEKDCLK